MVTKQRPEGGEGVSHVDTWGKSMPGWGNSQEKALRFGHGRTIAGMERVGKSGRR